MNIYLFGVSALEYWRSICRETARPKIVADEFKDCQTKRITKDQLAALAENGVFEAPVHVLVAGERSATVSQTTQRHVCRQAVSSRSFVQARPGILVPTPEYLFKQMAEVLDSSELVRLGYELCGGYAIKNRCDKADSCDAITKEKGFYERSPLTSIAKLQKHLEKSEGSYGSKAAREALRHVVEGAASPMETEIAMKLSLPSTRGGYGLPKPLMNKSVELNSEARRVYGRRVCRPDLLWPEAKLCVEYNGEKEHTGIERIASDAARDVALAIMKYEVVTVTRKQRNNPAAFEEIARYVAKRIGKRLRIRTADFEQKRAKLNKMFLTDI